ncbi:MAG: nucleotidyltransferase domain-containing protein [Candidatus Bathyarchaeia archaeon]
MAKKPVTRAESLEVVYDEKQWRLIGELRAQAIQIMEALERFHLQSIVHGSIARGDVSEKSDIDVFLPDPPSSFIIENALERAGIPLNRRLVVQATPLYAVKGHIEINEQNSVSFPLTRLRPVERGFYKFGGEATLTMLKENLRVPGVDKRLMLIEPTPRGHMESTILGREEAAAHLLGVSLEVVLDRVRALLRRDEVGRTGVFIKRELQPDETFEIVLKKLADQNPAVRRRLKLSEK